jgi:hypothetical protein
MGYRTGVSLALGILLAVVALAQAPYEAQVETGLPFEPSGGVSCSDNPDNAAANCGFETGDFTSWLTQDLGTPFFPLTVSPGGTYIGYGFFTSAPTEGTFAALTGWDGDGPGEIRIEQDVTLLAGADFVTFDYRGAWDLATFGATQDRTFEVHVEPPGGGPPLQSDVVLTAMVGTIETDTGNQQGMVDISGVAPGDVRLSFVWTVPEEFSGPAFFQLDNVNVNSPVPVELMTFEVD